MLGLAVAALLAGQAAIDLAAPIAPGKARIVFYRTGDFYFGGRGCSAYAGGEGAPRRVAELGRNEYALLDVAPGAQRVAGGKRLNKPVALDLAAGQTHYVRCEVAGIMGGSRLVVSDALEFERHRADLRPAD